MTNFLIHSLISGLSGNASCCLSGQGVVRGHSRWGTGCLIYIIQTSPPVSSRLMAFPRVLLSASPLPPSHFLLSS